jgi:Ca2+-binding EF-hand superfamily protein|tara:strand:+ start:184 stop:561 length:378 start_codon:yes stop_codon:yes gene_type:complete
MTVFDDDQFIGLVNSAWDVTEPAYKTVTQKDLETVLQAIRAGLLKAGTEKHTEEFILREIFREHDRNSNGSLSKTELGSLLNKINLKVDDKYLEALIKKLDMNGNGSIEFEEFVHFIVQDQYHRV